MLKYFTRERFLPFVGGVLMTVNFMLFWAIPVAGMGALYKQFLKKYLQPIYLYMEGNSLLRSFASKFIYNDPRHADFFPMSLLIVLNCSITIPFVFYWQLTTGALPAWLIAAYYCSWVGIGGSIMGGAYGLAHKEGHMPKLYREGVRTAIGNLFENGLGLFFGNVPWNFTTSHVRVHHAVNGGMGDSFYLWDFERDDPGFFMIYVWRVVLHMCGYSSIRFLRANNKNDSADLLLNGVYTYIGSGVAILALTRSFSFLWWMYLEPFMCMAYFLALINIGFHGFLECDETGKNISCVDATAIVNGEDDLFGEDDHMTHHYKTTVYFKDLPAYQATKIEEWKKHHASVFQKLSIVELSIFIILGLWDELADKYVDFTGEMTKDQIKDMLRRRARRVELPHEDYLKFLEHPSLDNRSKVKALSASPTPAVASEEKKSG